MDQKKYQQLYRENKALKEENAALKQEIATYENLARLYEESKEANKSLLAQNTDLKTEVESLRKQICSLHKQQGAEGGGQKFKAQQGIDALDSYLKDKSVLLLTGNNQFRKEVEKRFPHLRLDGEGFRNCAPEKIKSLTLLLIATDMLAHADTGRAKNLAVKYGVPHVELYPSGVARLREELKSFFCPPAGKEK